jgi:hypothetical protein
MGALPSQQAAAWPLPSASSGCGRLSGAQLVASLLLGSSAATDGLSQQGESSPGSQQPLVSRRPCSLSLLLFPWPLAFLVLSDSNLSPALIGRESRERGLALAGRASRQNSATAEAACKQGVRTPSTNPRWRSGTNHY